MRVPGVVLAAGRSLRMGRPKALLPLPDGEPFCSHVASTLARAGLMPIIVVVRPDSGDVAEALARVSDVPIRMVVNPDPERGQLSSLQEGLAAIDAAAPAAVVTLVDVPLLLDSCVQRLIQAWRSTRAPLVRPLRAGRHGHPIVVDRVVMARLLEADAALSAREVLEPFIDAAVDVPIAEEGMFEDVDTPQEYARLMQRLRTGG